MAFFRFNSRGSFLQKLEHGFFSSLHPKKIENYQFCQPKSDVIQLIKKEEYKTDTSKTKACFEKPVNFTKNWLRSLVLPVLKQKPSHILPSNCCKEQAFYFWLFAEIPCLNNCTLQYVTKECMELKWLCERVKKIRSSQYSILQILALN